eukprot:48798_1
MSSWLNDKRKEVLNQQFSSDILIQSLVTNKKLKRKYYACKDKFITLDNIPLWQTVKESKDKPKANDSKENDKDDIIGLFSTLKCDITALEIDCIVNAANEGLLGGGGIDEAIHKAAGPLLQFECANLPLCNPGNAVITKGYLLPCSFVIHTVGPYLDKQNKTQPNILKQCYKSILDLCIEFEIKSIAIPSISTGFYGFPKQDAANVAVNYTFQYILDNNDKLKHLKRIIFVDISQDGIDCYNKALKNLCGD